MFSGPQSNFKASRSAPSRSLLGLGGLLRRVFGDVLLLTCGLVVLLASLVLPLTSFGRALLLVLGTLVVERGHGTVSGLGSWVLRGHVAWVAILVESGSEVHDWSRARVLVWIEATQGNDISQALDLDHRHLVLHGREVNWADVLSAGSVAVVGGLLLLLVLVEVVLLVLVVLELLRHGRQSHAFWQVGQRIDQISLLVVVVVERAAVAKLALSSFLPVLAWLGLVVGVHSSKSGLAKVLGKRLNKVA